MLAGSKQNVSVHPGFGWGWREETEGLQPTNQPKTHHSEWSVADGCGTLSYSSLQLQQPKGFRWKWGVYLTCIRRAVEVAKAKSASRCRKQLDKVVEESSDRLILPQRALQLPESSSRVGWSLNSDQFIPVLFCVLFPSACVAGCWKGCAAEGRGSFDMPHYATLLSTGNICLVSLWKYRWVWVPVCVAVKPERLWSNCAGASCR